MLSGLRGRIGRALPKALMRRILVATLDASHTLPVGTIDQVREMNERVSICIAHEIGINVGRSTSGMPLTVQARDWPQLRERFRAHGLCVQQLHAAHSYAAETAWSVSHIDVSSLGVADLSGTGAIWQVFPGAVDSLVDAQDFDGPVDAVYTWVDADDAIWDADYQKYLKASGRSITDSSVNRARFASRDELKYSLRSLELNLPWIDKIYLVTAGQQPEWLVEEHPRLTLVDHREIFKDPCHTLPTFNSHAIESQLSNIRGLKEHFLYINDDVFFGRYLHPNTFFGPAGQAKYSLASGHFSQAADAGLPINRAAANNRKVILEHFGRTTSRKFQHVAHPQRLAVHRQIFKDLGASIDELAQHRFRSESDISIPSSLAHQYAARMGLGIPSVVKYQYLDIGDENFLVDMYRLTVNLQLDMFCINEVLSTEDHATRSRMVRQLLEAKFPVKSSFEVAY